MTDVTHCDGCGGPFKSDETPPITVIQRDPDGTEWEAQLCCLLCLEGWAERMGALEDELPTEQVAS